MNRQYIFGFVLLALISCNQKKVTDDGIPEKTKIAFNQKADKIKNHLMGKTLEPILGDSLKNRFDMFIYYSSSDCNTCLTKAGQFYIENQVSQTWRILSILKGINIDRAITNYLDPVYYDSLYRIDDYLGYIPTPSLIKITPELVIKDIYPITVFEDSIKLNEFIQR